MKRLAGVMVLLLAVPLLGACGAEQDGEADYPDGAVRLQQNVPTPYDDYTLTAINLDGSKGIVVVEPPSGGHTNVPVEKGGRAEADGLGFEVVDVVEAEDGAAEPGARGGLIVIVPEG